jgi:uncharacterized protein (TIGR02270 family)
VGAWPSIDASRIIAALHHRAQQMSQPKAKIIFDLCEEHHDHLAYLWQVRQVALSSPAYTLREIGSLEERIEARAQALIFAAPHSQPFLEGRLKSEDPFEVFASAYTLLRLHKNGFAEKAAEAFLQSDHNHLPGFREALCHGPIDLILAQLIAAADNASPEVAVTATEALVFHDAAAVVPQRLTEFFKDERPLVRQSAWRVAANSQQPLTLNFEAGINDPSPDVRYQALVTAAWKGEAWMLDHCRRKSREPDSENELELLSILGESEDLDLLLSVADKTELGPERLRWLGMFGHPEIVAALLKFMKSDDLRTSIAAGAAFSKVTGLNLASGKKVQLQPEDGHDPDGFEIEFLEEVPLPDSDLANRYWQKNKPYYLRGTRWCRGLNLSSRLGRQIPATLDMESRREACLRARFEGDAKGRPADLEVFPQT